MADNLTAWSNSRADIYRQCAKHAKLRFLDKKPELPRDLPTGRTEHANTRGQRIHNHAELVVKQGAALSSELLKFKNEFLRAQELYEKWPELVETEEMWCFNEEWEPVPKDRYDEIWLRVIIDLNIITSKESRLLVDFKSGKKFGNEVKHHEQMMLYTLSTFLRYPEVEEVTAELWYLDANDLTSVTMTRDKALSLFNKFNNLGVQITSDTEFLAKPSLSSCRFCPYRTGTNKWVTGTGDCDLNPPDKTELSEATWFERRNEGLLKLKEIQLTSTNR
jgi:hypothetical protein